MLSSLRLVARFFVGGLAPGTTSAPDSVAIACRSRLGLNISTCHVGARGASTVRAREGSNGRRLLDCDPSAQEAAASHCVRGMIHGDAPPLYLHCQVATMQASHLLLGREACGEVVVDGSLLCC